MLHARRARSRAAAVLADAAVSHDIDSKAAAGVDNNASQLSLQGLTKGVEALTLDCLYIQQPCIGGERCLVQVDCQDLE